MWIEIQDGMLEYTKKHITYSLPGWKRTNTHSCCLTEKGVGVKTYPLHNLSTRFKPS